MNANELNELKGLLARIDERLTQLERGETPQVQDAPVVPHWSDNWCEAYTTAGPRCANDAVEDGLCATHLRKRLAREEYDAQTGYAVAKSMNIRIPPPPTKSAYTIAKEMNISIPEPRRTQ